MSLKKILSITFVLFASTLVAQTTIETNKLLNPKPILLGGGIVIGGSAHSFQMGLNPELLKSYTSYLDGGLSMNLYYESYNAFELNPIRSRNFHYGIGTFARVWPIESLFIQLQPEYNWTASSQKNVQEGTSASIKYGAGSLLAGIGYGHHSKDGMTYMSIMFDLLNDARSPYRDGYNRAQPIFRAGIGFPINVKKRGSQ